MSACSPVNFSNVTPQVFACVVKKVQEKYGITISTNTGKASRDGFTVEWDYRPTEQTAMVRCIDSPGPVPCVLINRLIRDIGGDCGGTTASEDAVPDEGATSA
jgi:hypothetical protein